MVGDDSVYQRPPSGFHQPLNPPRIRASNQFPGKYVPAMHSEARSLAVLRNVRDSARELDPNDVAWEMTHSDEDEDFSDSSASPQVVSSSSSSSFFQPVQHDEIEEDNRAADAVVVDGVPGHHQPLPPSKVVRAIRRDFTIVPDFNGKFPVDEHVQDLMNESEEPTMSADTLQLHDRLRGYSMDGTIEYERITHVLPENVAPLEIYRPIRINDITSLFENADLPYPRPSTDPAQRVKNPSDYFFIHLPDPLVQTVIKGTNSKLPDNHPITTSEMYKFLGQRLLPQCAKVATVREINHPFTYADIKLISQNRFAMIMTNLTPWDPDTLPEPPKRENEQAPPVHNYVYVQGITGHFTRQRPLVQDILGYS